MYEKKAFVAILKHTLLGSMPIHWKGDIDNA